MTFDLGVYVVVVDVSTSSMAPHGEILWDISQDMHLEQVYAWGTVETWDGIVYTI